MQRIIIFANGEIPNLENARLLLRSDDHVICADGGTGHALALGLTPNLVIGDIDSLDKEQWQKLEDAGVPIELFPRDKNETDLELASIAPLNLNHEKSLLSVRSVEGWIKYWVTPRYLATCDSRPFDTTQGELLTSAWTMGWRKYSFVGIRLKSGEEAATSSH